MPPFGIALVVYIACGGLLWFTAHLLAPVGYQVTLWRGVGAAILISLVGVFSPHLKPFIGEWFLPVDFLLGVLIVKKILWLSFWRSVVTVIIYTIAYVTAGYFLVLRPAETNRRPNHALQRTRPSSPGCNPRVSWAGSLSSPLR